MIRILKAFEQNENFYVVFNFSTNSVKMITKEELNNRFLEYKIEGTLVNHTVQNAWNRAAHYVDEDGSLVYLLFVKDIRGKFHRLKFNVYSSGKIERNSLALATNDALIKSEFGEGLF